MELISFLGIHIELPVWFILLTTAVSLYYLYMGWYFDIFQKLGCKYDKPLPFIGSLYPIMRKGFYAYDRHLCKTYGKVVGTFFGRQPQMLISDPKILKHVLVKDFHNFTNRFDLFGQGADVIIAEFLTLVKDEKWKTIRSTLTPTFSSGKLRQMTKQIMHCADQMVKHMERDPLFKSGFDMKKYAGNYTMDVIASVGFGIQLDSQADENNEFVKNASKFFNFSFADKNLLIAMFFPFMTKILLALGVNISLIPKGPKEFFLQVFRQTMDRRKEGDQHLQTDLLQLMLDAHNLPLEDNDEEDDQATDGILKKEKVPRRKLTEIEIVSQSILFILAGYETTANTLSMISYCLATNPKCQDKVIEEIQQEIGGKSDITYDDVKNLKYLQQVIDETLRMYPLAHRLDRMCKEDIRIDGVFIPKDMDVVYPVMQMHHDPALYPDPEKFDPDRFSDEERAKRDPFTYFPFGAGPRNCIGMRLALLELKVAVVKLLQKYRFAPCPKTEVPIKLQKVQSVPESKCYWVKMEDM